MTNMEKYKDTLTDMLAGDGENMMKKINVVLEAYIQTGECTYTNVFKTVPIEVPDDGIDWHVAGEEKTNQRTS